VACCCILGHCGKNQNLLLLLAAWSHCKFSKAGFVSFQDHAKWQYLLLFATKPIAAAAAAACLVMLQVQQVGICQH
jgi:hypothetical protein